MHLSTSPKVVYFDAAGTLIQLSHSVGWHYRDVALRHGCDLPEDVLNRAFGSEWKRMAPPAETRQRRPDDDKGWWELLVGRVMDRCANPEGQVDRHALFLDLYDHFALPGVWELFPEVPEVLEGLASRSELGIISNFDGRLRTILEDLGVAGYFRHWIISSEVGAEKPSPWIFEEALRIAGVGASEALHVGDEPEADWQGAELAGLHVFRLARPDTSLRDLLPARGT